MRRNTGQLSTIANQIAMAIKNSHLVDMLAQKNLIKGLFDDLMYGTYDSEDSLRQRANFIVCDLTKPHIRTYVGDSDALLSAVSAESQQRHVGKLSKYPCN